MDLAKMQRRLGQTQVVLANPNVNGLPAVSDWRGKGLKGRARWIEFWRWSLEEQAAFLEKDGCTFVANEGEIDETFERLDGFTYVICLRNAANRYVSHFLHAQRDQQLSGQFDRLLDAEKPQI